jgi:PAS domain S-box-containing protein
MQSNDKSHNTRNEYFFQNTVADNIAVEKWVIGGASSPLSLKIISSYFSSVPCAWAYHKIIVDENNLPIDYLFLKVNSAFEELTGLKSEEVLNQRVTKVIPRIRKEKPDLIKLFGRVAQSGVSEEFELYSALFNNWFNVKVLCPERGYFVCVFEDITEQKASLKKLKESQREVDYRNRISQVFLTETDEEMYVRVLDIIREALASPLGTFGYINEEGSLVVPTMTRNAWEKCLVADKTIVFKKEEWGDSIWPNALRKKKLLYSNVASTIVPSGHVPIIRNLVIPLIYRDVVIGVIHVANKETNYTDSDIKLVTDLAGYIAPILSVRLERDREEKKRIEAQNRRFDHILDNMKEPLLAIDTENRIMMLNDASAKIFEINIGESFERRIDEILTDKPFVKSVLKLIQNTNESKVSSITKVISYKELFFNASLSTLIDTSGTLTG